MTYLRTDQYTHVGRGCPIAVELQPADDVVEIVLGEVRLGGGLRLQIDHPETCARLMASLEEARRQLAAPRRADEFSQTATPAIGWTEQSCTEGP